jgi:proteasome lid subunit RPN8/RPN11
MLSISKESMQSIKGFAAKGYPYETCGVMLGESEGLKNKVSRILELANINEERANDRFEMDPDEMFAAQEEARGAGEEIVGIWHSHPDHPAQPSQTDLNQAWPQWSYVIASVEKQGVVDFRSWRLAETEEKSFEEEVITNE